MRTSYFIRLLLVAIFIIQNFCLSPANAAEYEHLPAPGQMILLSTPFNPVMLEGLTYNPAQPFKFGFIVRPGDTKLSDSQLRDQSMDLVRYFLATLTMPQKDVWVNLSPYEKNRIIPEDLASTHLGGDLLAQDYLLKQLTSSLIFPDGEVGKSFWKEVYITAIKRFGRLDVPFNTFNKVWIVPQSAEVFVHDNAVVITGSHLKVMMEKDYLAASKSQAVPERINDNTTTKDISDEVMRQVILPVLEKEINEGSNFAPLRQVLNTAILAEWYKRHLKQSILSKYYADQHKVAGIDSLKSDVTERIYQQYLNAYKKGVYNFIREDKIPGVEKTIPRKYFSGGLNVEIHEIHELNDGSKLSKGARQYLVAGGNDRLLQVGLSPTSAAMSSLEPASLDEHEAAIRKFIDETENPFLTTTRARLHKQTQFLENKDPQLVEILLKLTRDKNTGTWNSFNVRNLGEKEDFEVRANVAGIVKPAKGGTRYITPADLLIEGEPFFGKWYTFLKLKPNKRQVKEFLAKWVGEEAEALAIGMALKTAGLELDLGGGKAAVFMGDIKEIVLEGDIEETSTGWVLLNWDKSKEPLADFYVARHHSRQMSEAGVVGIYIDSPAPDVGTLPEILEAYNDEYWRVIIKRGEDAFLQEARDFFKRENKSYTDSENDLYKEIYTRLKNILNSIHEYVVNETPLLEEAVRFSYQHRLPMPWNGVFTGKRVERDATKKDVQRGITENKIKMGGVKGRVEATGEGNVIVMMHFLNLTAGGYLDKTVSVQAFGNVGRYTALAAAREGFKVKVINDLGITLIKESGWLDNELKAIIRLLDEKKGKNIYELWHKGLIPKDGVEAVIATDFNNKEQMDRVLYAVLGAKVDILVPAAKERQITKENWQSIEAHWIFEGANGPTTPEAERNLINIKKAIVIPDTLVNSNGVATSREEMEQAKIGIEFTLEEVRQRTRAVLHKAVEATLKRQKDDPTITLREAFDRVALFNLAKRRMKILIDDNSGELNEIRQYLEASTTTALVRERIRNLGLDDYWHQALEKDLPVLKNIIHSKLDGFGIDLNELDRWIDIFLARLQDQTAMDTLDPDDGPLVYVRVLRRILEPERVSSTQARMNLTLQNVIRLRQELMTKLKHAIEQDGYLLQNLYTHLDIALSTLNDVTKLPNATEEGSAAMKTDGGINLNTSGMNINQTGKESVTPWVAPSEDTKDLKNLKGFKPVFIDMQPVNMVLLLGLNNG